ncbi:MAG TPA: EF-hand domain-containing protein [Geminicoccaceae bacterium]
MEALRERMFSQADTDRNGGLSLAEFKVAGQQLPGGSNAPSGTPSVEAIFGAVDIDGNGSVTTAEAAALKPPPRPDGQAGATGGAGGGAGLLSDSTTSAIMELVRAKGEGGGDASPSGGQDLSTLQKLMQAYLGGNGGDSPSSLSLSL